MCAAARRETRKSPTAFGGDARNDPDPVNRRQKMTPRIASERVVILGIGMMGEAEMRCRAVMWAAPIDPYSDQSGRRVPDRLTMAMLAVDRFFQIKSLTELLHQLEVRTGSSR